MLTLCVFREQKKKRFFCWLSTLNNYFFKASCRCRNTRRTYSWRSTTAIRVHCGVLWMMFVLVNLQSSSRTKKKKWLLASRSADKSGHEYKNIQQTDKQNGDQANSVCNSAMMYVCVTAQCFFFALSQWSDRPLDRASDIDRRIPGSWTVKVLLTHGDLIATLLKTS